MLELRPTCEHCNKALPPNSLEARICSYECTFCATCVESVLGNVCPNCGGGFVPRPINRGKTGKETTSSAKTLRAPISSTGPLISQLMRSSRLLSGIFHRRSDSAPCPRRLTLCCCRRAANVAFQQPPRGPAAERGVNRTKLDEATRNSSKAITATAR